MNQSANRTSSKGFPLGALFLLIAVVASIIAQLTLLREYDFTEGALSFSAFVGAIWGSVFGLVIGLHDLRRGRGAVIGILVGLMVGASSGPIAVACIERPWITIGMATATGIGLITLATIYRKINSGDPIS